MDKQELLIQKGQLVNQADEILKKAKDEGRFDLSAEENQRWDAIHVDIDKITAFVQKLDKQDALAEGAGRRTEQPQPESRHENRDLHSYSKATENDKVEAFRTWCLAGSRVALSPERRAHAARFGYNLATNTLELPLFSPVALRSTNPDRIKAWLDETRAALTGAQSTTTTGGYTVADAAMQALEVSLLEFGGMRQVATIYRTATGGPLPFPTVNDTANKGEIIAENTTQNELEMTFGQLVLDSYKYTSKYILASVEFLQDSSINVAEFIGGALGTRIARIQNDHFTTGTGSSQPKGIVVAAGDSTVTAASSTVYTYDELLDVVHSIDPAYRKNNARWMFNDTTLKTFRKVKVLQYSGDTTGLPLWAPGLSPGVPDTILGFPYVINQSMASPATTAKSVIFGDLSKYIIRDVRDVTLLRLDERFAELQQVAFLAFSRSDGDLLDAGTDPVKWADHT